MVPVYRPDNPVDLALAESLLAAENIPYFVHNNHFGSLYPGVQIELFNVRTIMVADEDVFRSRKALADLLAPDLEPALPLSPGQIFRMLFEAIAFGWFFPAKRRKKEKPDNANAAPEPF